MAAELGKAEVTRAACYLTSNEDLNAITLPNRSVCLRTGFVNPDSAAKQYEASHLVEESLVGTSTKVSEVLYLSRPSVQLHQIVAHPHLQSLAISQPSFPAATHNGSNLGGVNAIYGGEQSIQDTDMTFGNLSSRSTRLNNLNADTKNSIGAKRTHEKLNKECEAADVPASYVPASDASDAVNIAFFSLRRGYLRLEDCAMLSLLTDLRRLMKSSA